MRKGNTMEMLATPSLTELMSHIEFPATRDDLLLAARRCKVDTATMQRLLTLPHRSFSGFWDVRRSLEMFSAAGV
ncbi:MAG: hypothetical protein JWP30_1992 [Homoserinimonas sp.]|jgi:hypothetical protein|nr:hypothetical protein [Homoserinimonas sp.]